MKTEVILCDKCHKGVAEHKCFTCDCDLCERCTAHDNYILDIPLCNNCSDIADEKFSKETRKNFISDFLEEYDLTGTIKEKLQEYLKKAIKEKMADNLSKDKEEDEEEKQTKPRRYWTTGAVTSYLRE